MVRIHVGQPISKDSPMHFEEKQILDFLKPMPGVFFSVTEIGRKAGTRKQFYDSPTWPRPYLVSLAEQGYLESNMAGQFCYKEAHGKKKRRFKLGDHLRLLTAEELAPASQAPAAAGGPSSNAPAASANAA